MRAIFKKFVQYYLWLLAKNILIRFRPEIIAISGITGKTIIKNTLLETFRDKYSIRANPKSYNTKFGLPLAILDIEIENLSSILEWTKGIIKATLKSLFILRFPKKLILELGVDQKGEMNYLLSLIKPKIAILTNIISPYTLPFTQIDVFTNENKFLVKKLPKNGLLISNYDDEHIKKLHRFANCPIITYGNNAQSNYYFYNIKETPQGATFSLKRNGKKDLQLSTDRFGRIYIQALVIAQILKDYWSK